MRQLLMLKPLKAMLCVSPKPDMRPKAPDLGDAVKEHPSTRRPLAYSQPLW